MENKRRLELAKARLEACLNAKIKSKEVPKQIIKTSETPDVITPQEKAKALQRKCDDKYTNHIVSKLLPSLNKNK